MKFLRVPSPAALAVSAALLLAALYAGWPALRTWDVLSDLPPDYAGCATAVHHLTREGRHSPLVLEASALKPGRGRRARVWSLIALRDTRAGSTSKLRGLVRDPDADVALSAATLLAFRGNDEGMNVLLDSMGANAGGDAAHLQFEAARGLFHLGYSRRVVDAHYQRMAAGDGSARAFLLALMQMGPDETRAAAKSLGEGSAPPQDLLLWWRDEGLSRDWNMPCEACWGEAR